MKMKMKKTRHVRVYLLEWVSVRRTRVGKPEKPVSVFLFSPISSMCELSVLM